jgi:HSP20 family molecular chaperone IbpA
MRSEPGRPGYILIEDIKSLPDGVNVRVTVHPHYWRPPTDVYEVEQQVVVRVEIAGMREEDFSILLDGRFLSIRGARFDASERRAYHQMEIPFGEFSSDVELPCEVDGQKIEAIYSHGFLMITLPKLRPQRIQVED